MRREAKRFLAAEKGKRTVERRIGELTSGELKGFHLGLALASLVVAVGRGMWLLAAVAAALVVVCFDNIRRTPRGR